MIKIGNMKLDRNIAGKNSCLSCENLRLESPWKLVPFTENKAYCRQGGMKYVGEMGYVTLRIRQSVTINAMLTVPDRYKTIARHCGKWE